LWFECLDHLHRRRLQETDDVSPAAADEIDAWKKKMASNSFKYRGMEEAPRGPTTRPDAAAPATSRPCPASPSRKELRRREVGVVPHMRSSPSPPCHGSAPLPSRSSLAGYGRGISQPLLRRIAGAPPRCLRASIASARCREEAGFFVPPPHWCTAPSRYRRELELLRRRREEGGRGRAGGGGAMPGPRQCAPGRAQRRVLRRRRRRAARPVLGELELRGMRIPMAATVSVSTSQRRELPSAGHLQLAVSPSSSSPLRRRAPRRRRRRAPRPRLRAAPSSPTPPSCFAPPCSVPPRRRAPRQRGEREERHGGRSRGEARRKERGGERGSVVG
jgi:hypothetical protein